MPGPLPPVDPSEAFPGYDTTALCLWMEARGEGTRGMQAVANVIEKRANLLHTSLDAQVVRPRQFSWTNPDDPQYSTRPVDTGQPSVEWAAWLVACDLAASAKAHALANIVGGATLYFNPAGLTGNKQRFALPSGKVIDFPGGWRKNRVQYTCNIGKHYFFCEV